jgi:hypothetical protein
VNVTLILGAAVAIMVLMGISSYTAYGLGGDSVRAEKAAEEKQAREESEAYSRGLRASARKTAATLQSKLIQQKALAHELGGSLAKHIAAMPKTPVGCPEPAISDGVFNDLNRALSGAASAAGGKLPATTGAASPADRKEPGGSGLKAR